MLSAWLTEPPPSPVWATMLMGAMVLDCARSHTVPVTVTALPVWIVLARPERVPFDTRPICAVLLMFPTVDVLIPTVMAVLFALPAARLVTDPPLVVMPAPRVPKLAFRPSWNAALVIVVLPTVTACWATVLLAWTLPKAIAVVFTDALA